MAQIRELDSRLEHAVEAYNGANVRLAAIEQGLKLNARHLAIARSSLGNAQRHLSERLVALYVSGDESSTLEVVLGAESLDDLLARVDAAERVSEQEARVLSELKRFRAEVNERKARLKRARAAQKRVVAERARHRRSVEAQLVERDRMLASVEDEIAKLQAEERRRQAVLAAQARARLAAQQQEASALEGVSPFGSGADLGEILAAPPSRYGGVGIAMQYLGIPYRWGGADPSGFDCSGFVVYVYAKMGVSLPHNAAMQYGYGTPVSKAELEPGDLVFFDGLGHNGIYIGGGQFIHAPHTGDVVKISSLSESWYAAAWVGARRL